MTKEKNPEKIAIERLVREIKEKKNKTHEMYLVGYHEAISNFIYDYTGNALISEEWEKYLEELEKKGILKRGKTSIDNLKE
jgi:hypothetical protein